MVFFLATTGLGCCLKLDKNLRIAFSIDAFNMKKIQRMFFARKNFISKSSYHF